MLKDLGSLDSLFFNQFIERIGGFEVLGKDKSMPELKDDVRGIFKSKTLAEWGKGDLKEKPHYYLVEKLTQFSVFLA